MNRQKETSSSRIFFFIQFSRPAFLAPFFRTRYSLVFFLVFTGILPISGRPSFGQTAPAFSPTTEGSATMTEERPDSATSEGGTAGQEKSQLPQRKPVFTPTEAEQGTSVIKFSTTAGEKGTAPPLESFPFAPAEWKNVSVGLLVGLYHPSLDTLNNILANPNVGILQDPNFLLPTNPAFPVTQRNMAMPHLFGLGEYGAEIQIDLNPKYAFIFTFSTWSAETRGEDQATIFTRSNQPPSLVPRDARYNVSINQYWWGLKYHLINDPGKKTFYLNIGLLGISSAYLTMDALERVITPTLSFDSVSVTEASGFGFTTRFGAGGEYQIQKWLSVGGRVNYVVGRIATLKITRFFSSGFAEPPDTPPDALPPDPTIPIPKPVQNPSPGDSITYAQMTSVGATDYITSTPQDVPLDLDGVEILFFIHFHF